MSMAAIAGIATVASAGYGIYSANKNSSAAQQQIGQQTQISQDQYDANLALQEEWISYLKDALKSYGENSTGIVEDAYSRVSNIISNIPSVSDLMGEAESLSLKDFEFRDKIQKDNLNFITGNTLGDLRSAQSLNASLAAMDPNAFQGKMGDVLKSNLYGLKALTVGEPSGSFANLSAQNLYSMSQQGLSNYLQISDFFSREGTVDPISPLQTAFDLQSSEFRVAELGINNEQWRGNNLLNVEATKAGMSGNIATIGLQYGTSNNNTLADNLIGTSNATIANNSATTAAITQSLGTMISGLTGMGATSTSQKALTAQQDYYNSLSARMIGTKYA